MAQQEQEMDIHCDPCDTVVQFQERDDSCGCDIHYWLYLVVLCFHTCCQDKNVNIGAVYRERGANLRLFDQVKGRAAATDIWQAAYSRFLFHP